MASVADGSSRNFKPVASFGAYYLPADNTTIAVNAGRSHEMSVSLAGQNYTSTGGGLRIHQKIVRRGVFTIGGGYQKSDFSSAGFAIAGPQRKDDFYYGVAGFDWHFNRHWTAGILFQHRENLSNFASSEFKNNQVSIQASARF